MLYQCCHEFTHYCESDSLLGMFTQTRNLFSWQKLQQCNKLLFIYIYIYLNNEYAWGFQSYCIFHFIYFVSFYYLVYIFYLLIFPFIFKSLHFQLCCCCFLVDHKWLEKSLANSGCFSVVISEAWDSFSIEVYSFLTPSYDWVILVVF